MSAADIAIRVAVLTVSDSSHRGERPDASGPALIARCEELGWPIVAHAIVPDDAEAIGVPLLQWSEEAAANLILTTGGTGITERDVTPEATRRIVQKELPGMAELIRQRGLEQTHFSVLSRAVVGTRRQSLIVNLPGSPAGAVFSLGVIEHLVPHSIRLLAGHTAHG